jgi:hypothetical protein
VASSIDIFQPKQCGISVSHCMVLLHPSYHQPNAVNYYYYYYYDYVQVMMYFDSLLYCVYYASMYVLCIYCLYYVFIVFT